MARQREYDRDEVLTRAMHAFWTHGYQATTLRDLTGAMGILRGSLYGAFASKRGLFLEALRHYDSLYREARAARLERTHPPRQAILATYEESIALAVEGGVRDGCLLVNTALELSPHDEEVAAVVARAFTAMEAFYRAMIERGQAGGDISPEVDPAETARSLMFLHISLQVLARSRPEEPLLRSIVTRAEALLGRAPASGLLNSR